MINTTDDKTVLLVVTQFRNICDCYSIGPECVKHIYQIMLKKNFTVDGIKFALISGHKDMFAMVVRELTGHDEV